MTIVYKQKVSSPSYKNMINVQDNAGLWPVQPPEGSLQQDEQLPDPLQHQARGEQPLPLPGTIHLSTLKTEYPTASRISS